MKNIFFVIVTVILLGFGGWYFVAKPIQTSNARKYCNNLAHQQATHWVDYKHNSTYYSKSDYSSAYSGCLHAHGL